MYLVILIMVLNSSWMLILKNLQYPLADPPFIVMTETGRSLEMLMNGLVNVLIIANIVLLFYITWWLPIVAYLVCIPLSTAMQKWIERFKCNFLFAEIFSIVGIIDLSLIIRHIIQHRS
jgi:hypothetical protein